MTLDEQIKAAQQMVNDLCCKKRKWVLSVPGRHDYDPDLVISGALRAAQQEIKRLTETLKDISERDQKLWGPDCLDMAGEALAVEAGT